jgi:hypothetical protein
MCGLASVRATVNAGHYSPWAVFVAANVKQLIRQNFFRNLSGCSCESVNWGGALTKRNGEVAGLLGPPTPPWVGITSPSHTKRRSSSKPRNLLRASGTQR